MSFPKGVKNPTGMMPTFNFFSCFFVFGFVWFCIGVMMPILAWTNTLGRGRKEVTQAGKIVITVVFSLLFAIPGLLIWLKSNWLKLRIDRAGIPIDGILWYQCAPGIFMFCSPMKMVPIRQIWRVDCVQTGKNSKYFDIKLAYNGGTHGPAGVIVVDSVKYSNAANVVKKTWEEYLKYLKGEKEAEGKKPPPVNKTAELKKPLLSDDASDERPEWEKELEEKEKKPQEVEQKKNRVVQVSTTMQVVIPPPTYHPPAKHVAPPRGDYRSRVTAMYGIYAPEKVASVDQQLEKYKGAEDQLIEALVKKFGPEPTDLPPATNTPRDRDCRARLQRFLVEYCPHKIPDMEKILMNYDGQEEKMFQTLVKKYGPEPPYPTNAADEFDERPAWEKELEASPTGGINETLL